MKENKITDKNRKTIKITSQFPLPSTKNEHTISIEEKALKHSFGCPFLVTSHITNR